jgi:catechol 2,3-dioxygenase-like lactoylglutathione lyase family enzyme
VEVEFIATIAMIAPDPPKGRELYVDAIGLPLEAPEGGTYFRSERIDGAKHFAVWPLEEAAQACFGTSEWPEGRPVPQVSVEFEVKDANAVQDAAEELASKGFDVLHDAREEPWGQTVARVQSAEGAIVGISYAPSLNE